MSPMRHQTPSSQSERSPELGLFVFTGCHNSPSLRTSFPNPGHWTHRSPLWQPVIARPALPARLVPAAQQIKLRLFKPIFGQQRQLNNNDKQNGTENVYLSIGYLFTNHCFNEAVPRCLVHCRRSASKNLESLCIGIFLFNSHLSCNIRIIGVAFVLSQIRVHRYETGPPQSQPSHKPRECCLRAIPDTASSCTSVGKHRGQTWFRCERPDREACIRTFPTSRIRSTEND